MDTRGRETGAGAAMLGLLLVAVFFMSGCGEEVTAAIEAEVAARKADVTPTEYMSLPIGCGTWHATRGAGQKWRVHSTCIELVAK